MHKRKALSLEKSNKIGVGTATIIGMNAMIGAGIFSITSLLASQVGAAGIITYLFAFFAVWFIAQSIARAAYLWPEEGSFYTYTRQWGGHALGLMATSGYLMGFLFAMTLLCKTIGEYLHTMIPSLSAETLGMITLLILVILNLLGAVLSQIGQYILIICTLFPLFATTILCLTKINFINLTPFMPHGIISILQGTRVAIFGLFGFECITALFNIVEKPEKNVPKALQYSLLLVGIIYFFFICSIILSIPLSFFKSNPNITIPQALQFLFPSYTFLVHLINFAIISAMLGTVHSMIWTGSSLLFSFSKIIQIRSIENLIKKRIITQKTMVLICGFIILISFKIIHNKDLFFTLTDIGLIFPYITTMIALLFQPDEWKSGQNIKTILGLTTACIIFGISIQNLIETIII